MDYLVNEENLVEKSNQDTSAERMRRYVENTIKRSRKYTKNIEKGEESRN